MKIIVVRFNMQYISMYMNSCILCVYFFFAFLSLPWDELFSVQSMF